MNRRTVRTAILTAALGAALSGLASCASEEPAVQAPAVPARTPPPITMTHQSRPVGEPTQVTIPALGVDERLHGVGLKPNGAMETPRFGEAGWFAPGPRPGAPGPAVVVAHVHGPDGDDVFARLHELEAGDRVTVRRTDGSSVFVVDSVERVNKDALPYDRIWNGVDVPVLRLITCGGTPDPVTRMYPDNTIVYAHLAR